MSSIRKCTHSPVVAYASLDKSHQALGKSKYRVLESYCMKKPVQVDYFAEDSHPESTSRPLWNEILESIEIGAVRTLVLPNLFHAFGNQLNEVVAFLKFLRLHNVRLKTIEEGFDTKRHPIPMIVSRFVSLRQL